jgi:hypothetical protein
MASLEDTVRSVVQDLIKNEVLFTALDVSNTVKQSQPHARHREVRDVVRGMFTTDIESQGWARTPITVTLGDGTTAEALLYHPLTDSWDLDNKYDTQQRAKTTYKPTQAAQATVTAAAQYLNPATLNTSVSVVSAPAVTSAPVVPAPLATARDQWNTLFATQPSLFPKK